MGGDRWGGEPEQRGRTPRVAFAREEGEGGGAREPCASALARGGIRQGSGSGGLGLGKPSSRGVAITPHGSRLRAGLKGASRGGGTPLPVTPVRRADACRFRSSQRESVSLHARQSHMVVTAPAKSFRRNHSVLPSVRAGRHRMRQGRGRGMEEGTAYPLSADKKRGASRRPFPFSCLKFRIRTSASRLRSSDGPAGRRRRFRRPCR